jgi:hypothetical protein
MPHLYDPVSSRSRSGGHDSAVIDHPVYWFALLEHAREKCDFEFAAAKRQLERLGIWVTYGRAPVGPGGGQLCRLMFWPTASSPPRTAHRLTRAMTSHGCCAS